LTRRHSRASGKDKSQGLKVHSRERLVIQVSRETTSPRPKSGDKKNCLLEARAREYG